MGEYKKPCTLRLCSETEKMLDRLQEAFTPFVEDRSSTVRLLIRILFALVFTPVTLRDVLSICQRIQEHTLPYRQLKFEFEQQSLRPRFRMRFQDEGAA